ncbi:hypothetical protein ACH5A3_42800 [Streptomyces echinatus]|uniref:hypothetical protein n=1 Tax=Streptomyces echinatus TaxID=67293 RepID=UPI0037A69BF6
MGTAELVALNRHHRHSRQVDGKSAGYRRCVTGVGAGDELLADVCRTLERADFDFALSDTDEDGLRGSPFPGWGQGTMRWIMRACAALRHALTVSLTLTGHAVRVDPATGVHSPEHLTAVADQLNRCPRKTLGWETPAERLHKLLAA